MSASKKIEQMKNSNYFWVLHRKEAIHQSKKRVVGENMGGQISLMVGMVNLLTWNVRGLSAPKK